MSDEPLNLDEDEPEPPEATAQATTRTLNVHHLAYLPGTAPWDYPDHLLVTLCEEHHQAEEDHKAETDLALIWALRESGALNFDLNRITQIIRELGLIPGGLAIIQRALDEAWTEARR